MQLLEYPQNSRHGDRTRLLGLVRRAQRNQSAFTVSPIPRQATDFAIALPKAPTRLTRDGDVPGSKTVKTLGVRDALEDLTRRSGSTNLR